MSFTVRKLNRGPRRTRRAKAVKARGSEQPVRAPAPNVAEVRIRGQRIDASDTNKVNIAKGIEKAAVNVKPNAVTRGYTTEQNAIELLQMIDITICSNMDRGFSLLDIQTDDEWLDNPNIAIAGSAGTTGDTQDMENLKQTTDKRITAENSFPSDDDPIYNLDCNLPQQPMSQKEAQDTEIAGLKAVKPAADLIALNQNLRTPLQLKQLQQQY
jgi:hypothetical protein